MYVKKIAIKNIGPIDELLIDFPFNEAGTPKPIVFVGENGTGKTILLSQIVDALFEIGNKLFSDVLPKEGVAYKYYKISGGTNLQIGKDKGFSLVSFSYQDKKIEYFDKIGLVSKSDFISLIPDFLLEPNNKKYSQKGITTINDHEKEILTEEFLSGSYFYQPAYRYEEPFWKNDPFKNIVTFEEENIFSGYLNKDIEIITSIKKNKLYLLDVVLDAVTRQDSLNTTLWNQVNEILRKVKQRNDICFGIGPRGGYRVSIIEQNPNGSPKKQLLPSIDHLSLGESILFNLFLNVIRHADTPPKTINNIQGIVIIDEIDVHLHTNLQSQVLPELIKLFPKVQFIITTHSPFLLLGMKKVFGEDGFEIRDMPIGEIITTERFDEFEKAYHVFKDTEKYDQEMKRHIQEATKPILFVEGDYDIKYIKKAAEYFDKKDLLEKIQIFDANGFGGLDKIWKNYNTKLSEIVPFKILLLYDCDITKEERQKGKVYKRVIPTIEENPIEKGMENLFPQDTIKKAKEFKSAFIDYTPQIEREVRGEKVIDYEKYEVNKDEKRNLCDWLIENGNKDDFKYFAKVFHIIEEILFNDEKT